MTAPAQRDSVWQMQESGTAAGLRGIDSVDGRVAWASGTGGTVLRTTDGGAHWTKCAVPDEARDGATLDLRGVEGFDDRTAIRAQRAGCTKRRTGARRGGCCSQIPMRRRGSLTASG